MAISDDDRLEGSSDLEPLLISVDLEDEDDEYGKEYRN